MRIILDSIFSCTRGRRRAAATVLLLLAPAVPVLATAEAAGVYQSPEQFVAETFPAGAPDAKALWLQAELRDQVAAVLGRPPAPRVRYWQAGGRTAWVLDEVGKDEPITAGVVVRNGAIESIRVLVFRESRGWEVKYPFFTRQFVASRLTAERDLDHTIDGITGATLSVRAMKKMARVALLLDAHTRGSVTDLATAR